MQHSTQSQSIAYIDVDSEIHTPGKYVHMLRLQQILIYIYQTYLVLSVGAFPYKYANLRSRLSLLHRKVLKVMSPDINISRNHQSKNDKIKEDIFIISQTDQKNTSVKTNWIDFQYKSVDIKLPTNKGLKMTLDGAYLAILKLNRTKKC